MEREHLRPVVPLKDALQSLTPSLKAMDRPSLGSLFIYGEDDRSVHELFIDIDRGRRHEDHHRPLDSILVGRCATRGGILSCGCDGCSSPKRLIGMPYVAARQEQALSHPSPNDDPQAR